LDPEWFWSLDSDLKTKDVSGVRIYVLENKAEAALVFNPDGPASTSR